jgi:hypothetical protein
LTNWFDGLGELIFWEVPTHPARAALHIECELPVSFLIASEGLLRCSASAPECPAWFLFIASTGSTVPGLIIAPCEVKYTGMSPVDAYNEWRAVGHKGIGTAFTGYLDEYNWRKLGLRNPRASGKSSRGFCLPACPAGTSPLRPALACTVS